MEVSGPEDDPFLSQLHQVQCPVCQQMMPAAHINSHLDRCLLLHPAGHAGHAEPAAGSHRAGERAKGPSPPGAKRRRLSESSALKQPATPTAAESSEGEGEEADDGGETESRESYDAPPTPSGARLIPDFPVARAGSPARKGSGKRPAAAAAAGSASPRSWDEAEAQEELEEAGGDGDADADGEDDPGHWDADAADAAFGTGGGSRAHPRALAAEEIRQMLEGKPLADKMRPDTLQDYIGQSRAVGQETLLRSLLETNEIPSLILWGPPGCGKTTLAHIIANNSKKHSIRFVTLSATNAKTNDVRDVIKQAQNEKSFFKRKTILFIDEIHRFNKSQQVNAALLSRCRVIVLEKLPVEAMVTILMRAINSLGIHILDSSRPTDPLSHSSNSSSEPSVLMEDKAVDTLAYLSDGDARTGLNGLQLAVLARLSSRKMFCKKSGQTYSPSRVLITENDVKEGLQRSHILYDRAAHRGAKGELDPTPSLAHALWQRTVYFSGCRGGALQLHLRPAQGHARLRPERLPLLARTHARGRRGPAVRGSEAGEVRQRGHRPGRPICTDTSSCCLPRLPLYRHARMRGASGPVCGLLRQSPEVDRGVQRLQQRQSLPAEPPGSPAPGAPAPEERAHPAAEGPGLWQGLQVQPHVQRARGAGVPARGAERCRLLQAEAVLTRRCPEKGAASQGGQRGEQRVQRLPAAGRDRPALCARSPRAPGVEAVPSAKRVTLKLCSFAPRAMVMLMKYLAALCND
ncbi:ATPase WRNIP1 isoform X2 [Heterocephalus glaber]|uniref:ATPase WRNIP1 isoform X2 n=1 Tax=Heterocephalus glaber TaxID=10181 RepID=A0AAX6T9C0_HETGA|nr:ATPase WRNIP1 isoform X2 [Heterocephalus glaber]